MTTQSPRETWTNPRVKLTIHPAKADKPFDEYSVAVWNPQPDDPSDTPGAN